MATAIVLNKMKLTKILYGFFIVISITILGFVVKHIIHTDAILNIKSNIYLFASAALLLVVIILLIVLTIRTESFYNSLKEFTNMLHSGKGNYSEINFPKNKFGEIGEDIIHIFVNLKSAEKYKQELTHNIAHELKTPVTSIRGYLETLIQQPDIDSKTREFFLERAYNQCIRLSALISDISVLNNIEEAGKTFETEPVNIKRCLREIESDLSLKLAEKNIKFEENIGEFLTIYGNSFLIYALFKNLIDNSVEHGGENITIHIEAKESDGITTHFTYYDTGVGVSEKHLARIFERFYRIDEGRNRKRGGSGLGLAIVKHTLLMHNGKITASNRVGGGLQFDFTISSKTLSSEDSHQ